MESQYNTNLCSDDLSQNNALPNAVPNALPNAVPVPISVRVDSVTRECIQCKKIFTPPPEANKNTAQYYRCSECLSLKEIFRQVVYSCSIC